MRLTVRAPDPSRWQWTRAPVSFAVALADVSVNDHNVFIRGHARCTIINRTALDNVAEQYPPRFSVRDFSRQAKRGGCI